MSSDATASHVAVMMIALPLLHIPHYNVELRANTTLLCLSPLNTMKTLLKQNTKREGNIVSSLTYFLSLSLQKVFYSFPKSYLGFEWCVRTTRPDIFV